MATRGITGVPGTQQTQAATPSYSKKELTALTHGFKAESESLAKHYKAASTPEAKQKVLADQTITATIDKFVTDVKQGKLTLPEGTNPASVVAPAIKPLLEAGFTYSIEIGGRGPGGIGGTTFNFSLKEQPGMNQDPSGIWISERTQR